MRSRPFQSVAEKGVEDSIRQPATEEPTPPSTIELSGRRISTAEPPSARGKTPARAMAVGGAEGPIGGAIAGVPTAGGGAGVGSGAAGIGA